MKAEEVIRRFKEQYGANIEHPDSTTITYGGITETLFTTLKTFTLALNRGHVSKGYAPYQITEEFVRSLDAREDNEK